MNLDQDRSYYESVAAAYQRDAAYVAQCGMSEHTGGIYRVTCQKAAARDAQHARNYLFAAIESN